MDTYHHLSDLPPAAESVVTIGTFDGLHKGHLAVLGRLVKLARCRAVPAVVLTFDPHPQHILASAGTPRRELIVTLKKKLSLLEEAGVDLTMVLKFDLEFSRISAEDFLEKIVIARFHPAHIIVGYDHHFGHQRRGDARFLKEHAPAYGYEVEVVDAVSASGMNISSGNIRRLVREGRCEEAEQLLGRPYEIPGKVTAGIGRGQAMDYPTANLAPDEPAQLIPGAGVYIVSADIHQQMTFGMCNVGFRPTFNGKDLIIEAHFFDLPEKNLYNRSLSFRFHHRIRDEHKFSSAAELRAQLDYDKQTSLEWITEYHGGKTIYAAVT